MNLFSYLFSPLLVGEKRMSRERTQEAHIIIFSHKIEGKAPFHDECWNEVVSERKTQIGNGRENWGGDSERMRSE